MMSFDKGVKGYLEVTVLSEHTATAMGSGLLDVFSTPSMVAMMEKTASLSVQEYLEEGESSVGAEISVRHLKPTAIGDVLRLESTVLKVEGRKITFLIRAWDTHGKIGEATHVRYVIDIEKFLQKIG